MWFFILDRSGNDPAPKGLRTKGMAKIAVIGTGISGLSAAYLLHEQHDITVYEKADRPGGHSRTVTVQHGDRIIPVDTGFIVFNEKNYPNLTALFQHLGVTAKDSDMSFGLTVDNGRLEWGAKGLNAVFGQRGNLLRPKFLKLVFDVMRFNAKVEATVEQSPDMTLGALLAHMKLGDWFKRNYLLPMAGAIWSCPPCQMLEFPARTFVRFFANHSLLSLTGQPQWRTLEGGSQTYVERLCAPFADRIRLGAGAARVTRHADGVEVCDGKGQTEHFDEVVFACHADEALAALTDPSAEEFKALGAISYQKNVAVLHRDASVMPKNRPCWASWIYHADGEGDEPKISVTYWMNSLQGIDQRHPLFVTLNPNREIADEHVFDRHVFDHPVFDFGALAAQAQLKQMQGRRNTWFCGAHMGHGFHEDGLVSAMRVAEALGAPAPWTESGRAAEKIKAGWYRPVRPGGEIPVAIGGQ
jgi:predicted NAD/FAD-binding protein